MIYLVPLVTLLLSGCGVNNYQAYLNSVNSVNNRPMVKISCSEGKECLKGELLVYERPIVPERPKNVGEQIKDVLTGAAPLAIGVKALDTFKSIATSTPSVVTNTKDSVQVVNPTIVPQQVVSTDKITTVEPKIVEQKVVTVPATQ